MMDTYFGDVLGQNGLQLDLRVKLAVDFLKSPLMEFVVGNPNHTPATIAAYALDLATELVREAQDRGLTSSMPEDDELSAPMRRHIRRQVRSQIVGQVAANEIAPEEAPKVQMAGNGAQLRQ